MECVEARAALKSSSFYSEVAEMQTLPSPSSSSIWLGGGFGVAGTTDDFAIEEYFDMEDEEEFEDVVVGGFEEEEEDEVEKRLSSSSSSSSSASISPAELEIPENVKDLETWANLMDDSIPDEVMTYPSAPTTMIINYHKPDPIPMKPKQEEEQQQHLFVESTTITTIPTTKTTPSFPAKPRTSRPRKPGSAWHQSQHIKPEPHFSSSSSSTSWGTGAEFSPSPSASEESGFIFIPNPIHGGSLPTPTPTLSILSDMKKPAKKKQKRQSPEPGMGGGGSVTTGQLRRCTHCQVQRTPQWRTGPLGPKTLCNACGVRFKSGRLFPEYRPACSPTFSSEVHSNSHRKVLEMRKRKENGEPEEDAMPTTSMAIMSC